MIALKRVSHALLILLIVGLAPISIWVAAGSALYQSQKAKSKVKSLTCSLNSDCPPGYKCMNGYCIPEQSF
jgi:hypothetical protein